MVEAVKGVNCVCVCVSVVLAYVQHVCNYVDVLVNMSPTIENIENFHIFKKS